MRKIRILFGMLFTFFVLYSVPLVSAAAIVEFPVTVDEDYTEAMNFVKVLNESNELHYEGRIASGLQPVQMDAQLQQIAMLRATEAVIGFAHYRPFNYPETVSVEYRNIKFENLGAGGGTGSMIYKGWYDSPGHKATMFDRDIRSVGVGCVLNEGTRYWILVTSEEEAHTPVTATGVKKDVTRRIPTETSRMQGKLFVQDWHFDSLAQDYTGNSIFYNKKGIGGRVGIFSNSIYKGANDPAEVLGFRIPTEMLTFSTSTPEVVSVTAAGVVTPKSTGTGTITATLKGDPSVSLTETITVLSNVKNAMPTMTFLEGEDFNGTKRFYQTGSPIQPKVKVVDCYGSVLEEGVDYYLEYGANTNIGLGSVKAVFINNYVTDSGVNSFVSNSFYILPAATTNPTDPGTGQGGSGSGGFVSGGTTGDGNTGGGTTGGGSTGGGTAGGGTTGGGGNTGGGSTGNQGGGTAVEVPGSASTIPAGSGSVAPSAPSVSVPKAKLKTVKSSSKGTMTVTWQKKKKADGYQVQYALNSKFTKSKKTKKVAGYKTKKGKKEYITSCTIKKLKSKKTYYVRIRAYKKVNGTKYYGAWTSAKKVKIK